MSRSMVAVDRFVALVMGVALIAAGVFAVLWWRGAFPEVAPSLDLAGVRGTLDQPWWPWVAGLVGALGVVLGLRWMLGHIPDRGVGLLKLPGSSSQGRLSADAGSVATAAADVLEGVPGIRSCSGRVLRERGQIVAHLGATIEPNADLTEVAAAADQVARDLASVLGRDDLRCLVQLKVGKRGRSQPRVQ